MTRTKLYAAVAALALALPTLPGCVTAEKYPVSPIDASPSCFDIPACSRNRVYVFLLSGHPFSGMEGLRQNLIDHGFIKIYSGCTYHAGHFAKEIQKILERDESPRFVIVSQGSAAMAARQLASDASVPIDLFVLLDETGVGPAPAVRVVFIHGEHKTATDPHVAEESYCLADAGWLGTVKHPETTKLLVGELCAIAAKIPVIERGPPCELANCPPCGGGWDFLRPDGNDSGCIRCKPLDLAVGEPAMVSPPQP